MRGCLKQPQRELRATLGRDQADMAAVAAQKLLEEPRHWPAQPLAQRPLGRGFGVKDRPESAAFSRVHAPALPALALALRAPFRVRLFCIRLLRRRRRCGCRLVVVGVSALAAPLLAAPPLIPATALLLLTLALIAAKVDVLLTRGLPVPVVVAALPLALAFSLAGVLRVRGSTACVRRATETRRVTTATLRRTTSSTATPALAPLPLPFLPLFFEPQSSSSLSTVDTFVICGGVGLTSFISSFSF